MSCIRLGCLGLRRHLAGLDTRMPSAIDFDVHSTSAVSKPSTTATAAAAFPRFCDDAALETYGTLGLHGCRCVFVGIGRSTKRWEHKTSIARVCLQRGSIGLTLAGLRSLGPPMTSVRVTSAVRIPSSTRSATTGPA